MYVAVASEKTRKDIIKKVKRVVLKLGSYVLTTPAWKLDRKVFNDITQTIVETRKSGTEFVLVSSGAIAAGMGKLKLQERPRQISQEQAAAAIGQISLMGLYDRLFGKSGLYAAQMLLSHGDLRDRKRFLNARHALNSALAYGAVPIINENDTTVVEEIKFGDNDYLSSLVTNLVQADLLIILTDIDGFYDKDPRRFPDAQLIPLVETIDAGLEKLALGPSSRISKGGMATKIKAAKTAARFAVPTIIANGKEQGNLARILSGHEIGTLILPAKNKLTSRKHWIAYTLKPQGAILVDDGARRAMSEQGKSLLPSGIVEVRGEFGAGEAVSCCGAAGDEFARGVTAYSSNEIAAIKGLKTSQVQAALGVQPPCPEVVNRDDMVLVSS
ncbi:MAG: glutamate 5-kinase [Deltaproteobacteria bacterium]|nr:glutamate 5-kinase [Deltaproteobacteria bacterium]